MGLAYRIAVPFGFGMLCFAFLWGILNGAFGDFMAISANVTTTENAATGRGWALQMWTWGPLFAACAAALGLLAGSVFDSRGGR
ncbi:hypothetical protein [Halomarina pelagica]|uniref:hypothetical protein n=1 Tax=Halomarina pelagica TaxID=2961599 RepID=UPI0020C5683E|nr:hypothetical protein [Halomarina sp. BND7]